MVLAFGKIRPDGSVNPEDAVDMVDQMELGYKYRSDGLGVFVTAFMAETEEQNFEATTQRFFDRVYEAYGVELEAAYNVSDFSFTGGVTWTNAEITQDMIMPEVVGNRPRRQADLIYTFTGSYNFEDATVGMNVIGTTDSFAQDNNDLRLGSFTQVNLFAEYAITQDLTIGLNVNNLFNTIGLTEAEEATAMPSDIIRARSILGRTSSATLRYRF